MALHTSGISEVGVLKTTKPSSSTTARNGICPVLACFIKKSRKMTDAGIGGCRRFLLDIASVHGSAEGHPAPLNCGQWYRRIACQVKLDHYPRSRWLPPSVETS